VRRRARPGRPRVVVAALSRRGVLAAALLGIAMVLGARLLNPHAPPLYDGISVAPEPYRYTSPPPDLASTNKPPLSGKGDLQFDNGVNKLATVQTDDKQVLAFFPLGAIQAPGPRLTITIVSEGSPPSPPEGNTFVGNVYRIGVDGAVTQPALTKALQVLLRIPPHALSSVRVFYEGGWHDTQWGVQTDYINLSMDHLGLVAAFDDGQHSKPPPKQSSQFNWVSLVSTGLIVVAIVLVVAGIVAQRRRQAPSHAKPKKKPPRKR
jgi:hypothetical protein